MEVTFTDVLTVVVIDGPAMYDGDVSGKDKAEMIKKLIQVPQTELLMEAMGKREKAAMIRETEHDWELIISRPMLPMLSFTEREVAMFERHSRMPVTNRWRDSSQQWSPWTESEEDVDRIPNLSTDWILL
jgi:hypothetical protein